MKPISRAFAWILAASLLAAASPAGATIVRMATVLGVIDIQLFDDTAPNTVANFLAYVNDGDYDGSFIHRSAVTPANDPFVIQGGGFFYDDGVQEIPDRAPIANEFGASNLRGTITMARIPGLPDSATNQWFFNLADANSFLDGVEGGFTVFGEVIGDGMDVVDSIAALPRWRAVNQHPALDEIPLIDFGAGKVFSEELVVVNGISVVPEPATALLLGGALTGLALARRRST